MTDKISQSFIKDYREYRAKNECGHIIKAKYVDGRTLEDPEAEPGAKELGAYFEFMAFGALPKDEKVPQPVYLKDNKTMDAKYRLATINAQRVKQLISDMGLKVIHVGRRLQHGRFTGTLDLIVEFVGMFDDKTGEFIEEYEFSTGVVWKKGDQFIFDLKYSGLVGETTPAYNKHGWKFSPIQKRYHGTQAIQYHMIGKRPFYFLVTQSNNKEGTTSDIRFFYIPVTDMMIEEHIAEANELFEHFQHEAAIGFRALPSLKRCGECPLRDECADRHTFPHPEVVDLMVFER